MGEGAVAPSGASRQTWLLLPQVGGFAPTAPREGALRPSTPGDFPVAGKVTKGAPRAVPFGIPRCVIAALAALAYASRRATFYHKNKTDLPL